MAGESISEEEYGGWTSTLAVRGLLWKTYNDGPVANEAILRHLGTGHLKAAYERGIWKGEDGQSREQLFGLMSETLWNTFAPNWLHEFWKTGDADIWPPQTGYGLKATVPIVTIIGVRFDPVGLAKMMDLPLRAVSTHTGSYPHERK
jgi:hypothetical protein